MANDIKRVIPRTISNNYLQGNNTNLAIKRMNSLCSDMLDQVNILYDALQSIIRGGNVIKGAQGPKGDTGDRGPKGDKGDTGEKGEKGERGEKGLKGDKGERGLDGAKGEPFRFEDFTPAEILLLKGEDGRDGTDGAPGAPGQNGPQGPQGPQGLQGLQGPAGPQGAPGADYPELIVTDERSVTLESGKYYRFGTCNTLSILIGAETTEGKLNKYMFEFDTPVDSVTNLSLPASITVDSSFVLLPNSHYIVEIQANVLKVIGTNKYYPSSEEFFKDFFNRDIVKVVIPEGVGTITRYLFYQCVSLTHVVLPSTLSAVDIYAFSNCLSLTTINFPEGLTTIADRAFELCSALGGILNLPTTLRNIGQYGFASCRSLTKIIIPESVTNIGPNAFSGCTGVTEVELPSTYVQFGTNVFNNTGVTSFTIPSWLTVIPGSFLSGCRSLTSVTIPNTVTLIQASAFADCSILRSITLPNSIVELQATVFNRCTLLTDVTVHDSITTVVSATSFSGIGANATFKIIGTTRVIPFVTLPNTTKVYVDDSMLNTYKAATGWSGIKTRIYSLNEL